MNKLIKLFGYLCLLLLLILVSAWLIFNSEHLDLDAAARAQKNMDFIDLPAGTVHFQLAGPKSAEVVVLVHGFSVPAYIWDPTFTTLTAAGYRVLRFDLYGRGYSDRPDVDYTIDFFASQLQELTQSLLPDTKFNLVGLSMGGPIVTRFSNLYPKKVKRLALLDPMVFPPPLEAIVPLDKPIIGEYLAGVYFLPQLAAGQENDFKEKARFPDWGERFKEQMQYRGFRRAILSTVRNFPDTDTLGEYKKLGQGSIPVHLFWGRDDKTVPLENSKKLLELIPQSQLSIIEDAGHIAHFERPEVFNPLLLNFLQQPVAY